tara:strand:- start:455 stop:1444 length:990 start_codon:yes stop_codon:yes gene_type:complete
MDNKKLKIQVINFSKSLTEEWDQFVLSSDNGTIFHLRKFLSYHIERKFNDNSLLFILNKKIIAILPAALIKSAKTNTLHSHPGASYGGLVYKQLSFIECDLILKALENYCRSNKISSFLLVPTPQLYHNNYNENLLYAMLWNNYIIEESYISSIVDLRRHNSAIKYLSNRKQRYIKNLNPNIHIKWTTNVDDFYPILVSNKKIHRAKPTHTIDELKRLIKLMPKSFSLMVTYFNDIPIGGTFNFIANKKVLLVFYNMINYKYQKYNPATYQLYTILEWAKSKKYDFVDFGVSQISTNTDPLSPHYSLINFKEQFGSNGMLRITLQKNIF